ncbi:MAG: dephospho-CoA kinase, partial [Bacteroidales bacterium]|nr:dephospho-CoA kinase [Bacteroidales bacterium]
MIKVGLTGNIGSGKSTVAKVFQALGIAVFHADQEAKKLYQDEKFLD